MLVGANLGSIIETDCGCVESTCQDECDTYTCSAYTCGEIVVAAGEIQAKINDSILTILVVLAWSRIIIWL